MKRRILFIFIIFIGLFTLSGCEKKDSFDPSLDTYVGPGTDIILDDDEYGVYFQGEDVEVLPGLVFNLQSIEATEDGGFSYDVTINEESYTLSTVQNEDIVIKKFTIRTVPEKCAGDALVIHVEKK